MSYPSDAHSDTKIEIIQFDSAFSTYLDYWSIYSNFWIEVLNLYDCAGDLTCGASLCLSFYLVKEFISFPNPLAQPGQSKSHLKNKHFAAWFDCKCNYWLSILELVINWQWSLLMSIFSANCWVYTNIFKYRNADSHSIGQSCCQHRHSCTNYRLFISRGYPCKAIPQSDDTKPIRAAPVTK